MGVPGKDSVPLAGHSVRPTRGSIYMYEFDFPDGSGSNEIKERPCLVVSINSTTSAKGTVTIIPFTTKESSPMATHVIVTLANGVSSVALCEYIKTISSNTLGRYQGQIDKTYIPSINRALMAHFGIATNRFATTAEILQKAEFVLKTANFMEQAEFPYEDTRKAVNGALSMVCEVDILKEPTAEPSKKKERKQIILPEPMQMTVTMPEMPFMQPKAPEAMAPTPDQESEFNQIQPSIPESGQIQTSEEESESGAMPEQEPEQTQSSEPEAEQTQSSELEPEQMTAPDLTIDMEADPEAELPIITKSSYQSRNGSSETIRNKLGLADGEYLMVDLARKYDKNIDFIWRIIEKCNLKESEYARKEGSRYIFNEKAAEAILDYLTKPGKRK